MNDLPAPLTPPDCDLRGLEYMPLLGHHLFGSDFNAKAADGEWRAAVTLWWAAWMQVPAGSLPDDDVALCRLADLGRDVKVWRRLRTMALHNFVRCSDGRLYHPVLAKQALIAWDKRLKERDRKAQWRAKQHPAPLNVPRDVRVPERGRDADVPADGTGRDGTLPPNPHPTSPGPAELQAVMKAGGMIRQPVDHQLVREWLALPDMQLDRDVLPIVERIGRDVLERTGKAPFKLKLFDAAIRDQHAADEAKVAGFRRSRERSERMDREQAAEREPSL